MIDPETATVFVTSSDVTGFVILTELIGLVIVILPETATVFEISKEVTGFKIVALRAFKILMLETGLRTVTDPETSTAVTGFVILKEEIWFVRETELTGFKIVTEPETATVFKISTDVTGLRIVKAEI